MEIQDLTLFDPRQTIDELANWIQDSIFHRLKKKGAVLGISGGIDSSVVAALSVKALGPARVLGVALPEKDSSPDSLELAKKLAKQLNIEFIIEDITEGLVGMGAYKRRDEAVKRLFPEFRPGLDFKIVLQSNPLQDNYLNVFKIIMYDEYGHEYSKRIPLKEYLQIVAASNMKQRLRMTMLYYHGENRNYAVVGTGNKNEHELGFFVKYGDGGADIKPILHLFKSQIYKLAKVLNIPEEIVNREPTTDTYPAEVTQEEFFFRLPFETMDAIWYASENGMTQSQIAGELDLTEEQVKRVVADIRQKHQSTEYLRAQPLKIKFNNLVPSEIS